MIIDKFIPGVYGVAGCNGWGKTKFLKKIELECIDNGVCYEFSDLEEDRFLKAKMLKMSRTESIVLGNDIPNVFYNISTSICDAKNNTIVWLIDNITGLDFKNSEAFKSSINAVRDTIESMLKDRIDGKIKIYVFVAVSDYDMASGLNIINPETMEVLSPFERYDEYKTYISRCHKRIEKRYKSQQENGNEKEVEEWESFLGYNPKDSE